MDEIQERLHNAQLFKDKLAELKPQTVKETDNYKIDDLKEEFPSSNIKVIGNDSASPADDIIEDLQIYNTKEVFSSPCEYIKITVLNDSIPVIYYFKNEYEKEDFDEIASEIKEYCEKNDIEFLKSEE